MKTLTLILTILFLILPAESKAQGKEILQMATLTPSLFVARSGDIESYHKLHYTMSALGYMAFYMVTDSKLEAAFYTLLIGAGKELIFDAAFGQGTPLWSDMKWNTLGVAQGYVFSVSLTF